MWMLPFPDKYITGHFGTMSDFRRKRGMQAHSGVDWARPAGTLIPAVTAGEVVLIQYSKVLGWVVVQTGTDPKTKKTKYIGYCHLNCSTHGAECKGPEQRCKTPLKATKVGDKVELGQKYLRVGNSGSATTGAHLHLTLSDTVKGVFGPTSVKQDFYKYVTEQPVKSVAPAKSVAPVKAPAKPAAKPAQPVKVVFACPHCQHELKA
jgi:murein DD-endopeptidase MepM/ murein hydrolase activator NlpD